MFFHINFWNLLWLTQLNHFFSWSCKFTFLWASFLNWLFIDFFLIMFFFPVNVQHLVINSQFTLIFCLWSFKMRNSFATRVINANFKISYLLINIFFLLWKVKISIVLILCLKTRGFKYNTLSSIRLFVFNNFKITYI